MRYPELSSALAEFLEEIMKPDNGYRLFRTDDNKIHWQARDKILTSQPSRGLIQSLGDFFGAFLPIEGQLVVKQKPVGTAIWMEKELEGNNFSSIMHHAPE